MRFFSLTMALALAVPAIAVAGAEPSRLEKSLMKLAPEDRAQQVCVAKGLETIRRDKKLKRVDRLMPDTFGRSQFDGSLVKAKGAAVRAGDSWYALSFDCTLASDQLKATAFTYQIGEEIPPEQWEDVGLWR